MFKIHDFCTSAATRLGAGVFNHMRYGPEKRVALLRRGDVTLHTEDKAVAQRWFDQLSEGGTPVMPFGETFWSPGFGSLIDRFGIPWMVNVVPSADWKPPQS
jgi:uncharacterized glyoxalase superfamily protein PhnB